MKRTAEQFRQDPESYVTATTTTDEGMTQRLQQIEADIMAFRMFLEDSTARLLNDIRKAMREQP